MADVTFRHDPADPADPDGQYVWAGLADGGRLPDDLWKLLSRHPYFGRYEPGHPGELKMTKRDAGRAMQDLSELGHEVRTVIGPRSVLPGPARFQSRGPRECQVCGKPFPAAKVAQGEEPCPNDADTWRNPESGRREPVHPPHTLVLVPVPR